MSLYCVGSPSITTMTFLFPGGVTCECAYDCAGQTQMHNVSHTVGRWYPSQMRDGPELVVVVDGEASAAFLELECDWPQTM